MTGLRNKELENSFQKAMLNIYEEAKKIDYKANRFIQMVANEGGVNVAKKLLAKPQPSEGLMKLSSLNRLDLTVESLVLQPEFKQLFTETELQNARYILSEFGLEIEDDSNGKIYSYSWEVIDNEKAIKQVDKSCIRHNVTGIPKKITPFFDVDCLNVGFKKEVSLVVNEEEYKGFIEVDSMQRAKMLWEGAFSKKLEWVFQPLSEQLLNDEIEEENRPLLIFNKVNDTFYNLSFSKLLSETEINKDIEGELAEEESYYTDGSVKEYYGKRYERNPQNRKRAIEIHGLSCKACGFNFEQVYGVQGKDFIEVHHLKPLSTIGNEVEINPEEDLVPLCSNCHRMVHRRKNNVLNIEQLKNLIYREEE